ncbi:MAG: DUF488 domain-containing protein [Gemmatimonadaceae bacterium]
MTTIALKRVYLPPAGSDGFRLLVDRVWPRGMTKEKAAVDHWLRDVAPTTALRQWFGHQPDKWPEFKRRYLGELGANRDATRELVDIVNAHRHVTILFGAHDETRNQAVVITVYLKRRLGRQIDVLKL